MSDLISRSELIKHFEEVQSQEDAIGLDFVAIIDEIKEQPTVYDIDKVVEELEKLQTYNMSLVTLMSDLQKNGVCRHYICLEDAIEIVKAGGTDETI